MRFKQKMKLRKLRCSLSSNSKSEEIGNKRKKKKTSGRKKPSFSSDSSTIDSTSASFSESGVQLTSDMFKVGIQQGRNSGEASSVGICRSPL